MLFDTHAHLDDPALYPDIDNVLKKSERSRSNFDQFCWLRLALFFTKRPFGRKAPRNDLRFSRGASQ